MKGTYNFTDPLGLDLFSHYPNIAKRISSVKVEQILKDFSPLQSQSSNLCGFYRIDITHFYSTPITLNFLHYWYWFASFCKIFKVNRFAISKDFHSEKRLIQAQNLQNHDQFEKYQQWLKDDLRRDHALQFPNVASLLDSIHNWLGGLCHIFAQKNELKVEIS